MKLGNYKWKFCEKCGKKYAVPNNKIDNHKCKKSFYETISRFVTQHFSKWC